MKYISNILESNRRIDISTAMKDVKKYIDAVGSKLDEDVKKCIYLLQKHNIYDSDDVMLLKDGTNADLTRIMKQYGVNKTTVEDLREMLKDLDKRGLIRLLPMLQSDLERDNFEQGNIDVEDVVLDFSDEKKRNDIAKKFMPVVKQMAHYYMNKSNLGREELYSAAMLGLTTAMEKYRKPSSSDKLMPFVKFAKFCMSQQIMDDMGELSRTIKVPNSVRNDAKRKEKYASMMNVASIDRDIAKDEDGYSMVDRIAALAEEPDAFKDNTSDEQLWNKVIKFVNQNFNQKQASMFFKSVGINGFKRMKQTDIAKEMGCGKPNVSIAIKKIVTAIKQNPEMFEAIQKLAGIYTESILIDNYRNGRDAIMEAFQTDDVYLLLEDMTRWAERGVLESTLKNVLVNYSDKDAKFLKEALGADFAWLDDHYRSNKKLIIDFLENMNPTEYIRRKTDIDLLNMFTEIADEYKKQKISL